MKYTKKLTAAAALACALAFGSVADADVWDGGPLGTGTAFEVATNWDTDTAPAGGITNDISGNFTVTRLVDSVSDRVFVDDGAVLNITGGSHSDSRAGNTIRNFISNSGDGTVNQSAGTMNIGHVLAIGRNGVGEYNLSGGDLLVTRGGNTLAAGGNSNSITLGWGTGTGLMDITGGSLQTRIGVDVGDTGTFRVSGDAATSIGIGSNGSADGHWWQDAGGVLSMGIGATGVTPIFVDDVGGSPFATFLSGSVLDLDFFGTAPIDGTWTLLELENFDIDDQGLVLSAATLADPNWSFDVDNTGTNGLLTATYTLTAVPEPTSLALIGLGGLFLSVRRRK